jgi:hypothetical protein
MPQANQDHIKYSVVDFARVPASKMYKLTKYFPRTEVSVVNIHTADRGLLYRGTTSVLRNLC